MTQKTKPLVTIVTITFNLIKSGREKTFRQCLESVHAQTYENIEHIIVDGDSNDGTVDLIKEYADRGWIQYVSEPDSGIYDAMNKGIKMAKGKYIAFLNSDDYYHGKYGVEDSIEALESASADFSYAPVINLDEENNKKKIIYPEISKIFFSLSINHQTMFFRKDSLIRQGMFDLDIKCIADYDMTLKLCLGGAKSVFVKKPFSTYRLGGFSFEATKSGVIFKEAYEIYFKNYSKLYSINKTDCEKLSLNIYRGAYECVSIQMATSLRSFWPYFDYNQYRRNNRIIVKTKRMILAFFDKIIGKICFVIFSPKKFIKKYFKY